MQDLEIKLRKVSELRKAEYNPRKISREDFTALRESIKRFGFIDPVIINVHPEREGVIIGGHQRFDVAIDLGYEEVPVIELNLTHEKEKELNLRLNRNQGEFDTELLWSYFHNDFLMEVGFRGNELQKVNDDYTEKLNAITNADAEMPIVPKWSEQYDSIIIFSDNELDFNYLKNVLEIGRAKDYKNTRIGECHVLTAKKFQKIIDGIIERTRSEVEA